jgi:hypothetical protein
MMVQEHISLRQVLLTEEDMAAGGVLSWYSVPIRQKTKFSTLQAPQSVG